MLGIFSFLLGDDWSVPPGFQEFSAEFWLDCGSVELPDLVQKITEKAFHGFEAKKTFHGFEAKKLFMALGQFSEHWI